MAAGRYCVKCGKHAVHRAPLRTWERGLAYLTVMRRDRCYRCGARPWVSLQGRKAVWAVLVAMIVWGGLLLALGFAVLRPVAPTPVSATVTLPPPVSAEAAALAHPAEEQSLPEVESVPEPVAEETLAFAVAAPTVADVAEAAAAQPQRYRLRGAEARWHRDAMEINLQLEEGQFPAHTLVFDKLAGGYVMDLPGHWQLPPQLRMSRSFTRSSLRQMNIGRHDEFLRIVFRLRGTSQAAPELSSDEGRLVLRFR